MYIYIYEMYSHMVFTFTYLIVIGSFSPTRIPDS